MDIYEKAGKRQFTRLCMAIAARDECQTMGLFWGNGGDSRLAFEAGFDVLAVDNDPSLFDAMAEDGRRVGYATFAGNARQVRSDRDMWHADFMNTPNPDNFKTVRHLAKYTKKWLAVTIATDHIKNPEMQGDSLMATLPAWLTYAASGFTLEYFGWYKRNGHGLRMWVALLRRDEGKGVKHQVLPVQIAYSVRGRGYWSSRSFYDTGLLPHRYSLRNEKEKAQDDARYQAKRAAHIYEPLACASCGQMFVPTHGRQKNHSDDCRRTTYRKRWYADNREAQIAAVKAWREARKAAVSGTAAEAID